MALTVRDTAYAGIDDGSGRSYRDILLEFLKNQAVVTSETPSFSDAWFEFLSKQFPNTSGSIMDRIVQLNGSKDAMV